MAKTKPDASKQKKTAGSKENLGAPSREKKPRLKKNIKARAVAAELVEVDAPSTSKTINIKNPKSHRNDKIHKSTKPSIQDHDYFDQDSGLDRDSADEGVPFKVEADRAYEDNGGLDSELDLSSNEDAQDSDFSDETENNSPFLPSVVQKKDLIPTSTNKGELTVRSSSDPLTAYLSEIRKYPLLTREKEMEIAKQYYETKDPQAAQILVQSNLRFVVKVAAEYSKFGAKMIDLIQEGNVGLMHAVREFNPYKGARLITYAVWWIKGYIQEYLMRQYSMVRIGTTQNQRKLYYQLQREKENLEALGKEPDIKLISSKLGIPEDEVQVMAQRMMGRDISLDKPLDEDGGTTLGSLQKNEDDLPIDDALARAEEIELLKQKIEEIRDSLNEKEKIILEERLLNEAPLTLQEIGEKYGITREAVRQAEVRLMKKIRSKMEEDL